MADKKEERLEPRESKYRKVDGVQVFTRLDDHDRPTLVDTVHEDEGRISDIADRLQRAGYGVMRRRKPRSGRTC